MWIEDPDGNRIEIMEMAPGCIQQKAIENLHAGKPPEALRLF
jgi:lactoylglutathione lyase